jgi:hypothetical protein
MHLRKSIFLLLLCAPLWTTAANPQDQSTVPVAGATPLGVTIEETAVIAPGWRASKLLHADVYNDRNEKIGKVDDFIVSPDGSLSVAVVDVGGFLHLAVHRVAIPVKQFGEVSPKIVLKGATKDALLKMPEFKYVA